MSIININSVISGMIQPIEFWKAGTTSEAAGVMVSTWFLSGNPLTGVVSTAGLAGETLTTTSGGGAIYFRNPNSGYTYLSKLEFNSSATSTHYIVCDRLWHNSGLPATGINNLAINSVAWPSRCPDASGSLTPNISGYNIMAALEFSVASTAATVSTSYINYTNSDGISNRTGICILPASPAINTFAPFALASGDLGIKSIENITIGSGQVSATFRLVAYREIAHIALRTTNSIGKWDAINIGMPRMFDNSVPFIVYTPDSTTARTIFGKIGYSQG